MSITDQQFEVIILRLEAGESIASVQADFPHLAEDMAALKDLQDFFAAQRLTQKPNPNSLKSVLRQVDLLQLSQGDDEPAWGAFFKPWMRYASVAVPVLMVVGVSSYLWNPPLPSASLEPDLVALDSTSSQSLVRESVLPLMASNQRGIERSQTTGDMNMEALVESLSNEFAADMAEFETTQESLEPLFSEKLFSYDNSNTL